MKDILFENAVLILLKFHFVLSQGTYFERIDKNNGNEISMVGVTREFHRCNLKKECNYIVKASRNDAVEMKDSLGSLSMYLAVWKKISISGEFCIVAANLNKHGFQYMYSFYKKLLIIKFNSEITKKLRNS